MKLVSTGKTISSPEFYKKLRRKRKLKLIFLCIIFFLLFIGIVFLARYDKLLIKEIVVTDSSVANKSEIISLLKEKVSGYYLGIFPRRNAFIYPRFSVEDHFLAALPRFKSASVRHAGLETLSVDVVEREVHAIYCAGQDEETCYFVDEEGFIFDLSPSFTRGVYFVYYQATTTEPQLGTHFLPPEEFRLLSQVRASLTHLGVEAVSLNVKEWEFEIVISSGARILWPRQSDPAFVYSNLEAFLNSEAIKAQGNFLERIIYLDLMTTNKIFYRFKE